MSLATGMFGGLCWLYGFLCWLYGGLSWLNGILYWLNGFIYWLGKRKFINIKLLYWSIVPSNRPLTSFVTTIPRLTLPHLTLPCQSTSTSTTLPWRVHLEEPRLLARRPSQKLFHRRLNFATGWLTHLRSGQQYCSKSFLFLLNYFTYSTIQWGTAFILWWPTPLYGVHVYEGARRSMGAKMVNAHIRRRTIVVL